MIALNKTSFSKIEDFTQGLLEVDTTTPTFPSGGLPLYTQGDKAYLDTSDSHSIVFGATGSKKTRLFVMPSVEILYRSGEAFVVTDPKGEIYLKTKESAKAYNYRTLCIDLRNLKVSHCWNPFQLPYELYHSGNKGKALEMLTELSRHIIGDVGEPFWTNTGIDLLLGFMLLLFLNNSKEDCTLRNLLALWNRYTENQRGFREDLRYDRLKTDEITQCKLRMIYNSADKTVGSAEAIVSTGLNKLIINDDLTDLLSTNSFNLFDLANKKVGIYLIIPDENTSSHFVASLFISQLYEVMIQVAQKSNKCALDVRMNFIIDEFANLPKLEGIETMITASRSRNIRFTLIAQGLTQLKQKYDETANTLCGNCNNWIYLYSKDYELLHTISRLCGEVIYDTKTTMPLLSEFDLQHLSKEKGEVLILAGRKHPFLSHLTDIDDYTFCRECSEFEQTQSEDTSVEKNDTDSAELHTGIVTDSKPESLEDSLKDSLTGSPAAPVKDHTEGLDPDFDKIGKDVFRVLHPELCKPVPGPASNFSDLNPARFSPHKPTTLFEALSGGKTQNALRSWTLDDEPRRWVVVVYDEVIIGQATPPECEVYAPDIYEKLIRHFTSEVLSKSMLQNDFEFYHADMKYKEEFDSYLNNHPEAVYLRLDEMKHPEDFVKITKVPLKKKTANSKANNRQQHSNLADLFKMPEEKPDKPTPEQTEEDNDET